MRALTSIAFNDFSGTSGDVTTRATKAGTVLTVRTFPSKVVSPAQKVNRNALSKISRAYKVEFEDLWVSPTFICFTGLETPKDSYHLVVRMSGDQFVGISYGWSKTVIVAAGVQEDWSEANFTRLYAEKIGYSPKLGEKVFLEFWWLDTETGFTGEAMRISVICKSESQIVYKLLIPSNYDYIHIKQPRNCSGLIQRLSD